MDDQGGRARFAEEQGAGFAISETDLDGLEAAVDMMMQPAARTLLRASCQRLSQPNGADAAAALIARLLGKEPGHERNPAISAARTAADERAAGASAPPHSGARATAPADTGIRDSGTEQLRSVDAGHGTTAGHRRARRKARATEPGDLARPNGRSRPADPETRIRKLRAQGNIATGDRNLGLRLRPGGPRKRHRNGGTPAGPKT